MVMKVRRCFFLKSKPGLWALIHSHDSRIGPMMMMRVLLSYPRVGQSHGKGLQLEISSANPLDQRLLQGLLAIIVGVPQILCMHCMVKKQSHDCWGNA